MKFLQRLGMLIGAVIFWFSMTLAIPILFTIFGIAIVGACVWSMKQKGGTHPPGIQFSVFGGLTVLIGVIGIAASSADADPDDYDIPPEIAEAMAAAEDPAEPDVPEEAAEDPAPEEDLPVDEPGSEDDSVSDADPETLRLASAQEGVEQAAAVAKDKARCTNIDEVVEVWENLQLAKKGDPMFRDAKKVAKRLERCRKKSIKKIPRKERKAVLEKKGAAKPFRLK